MEMRFFVNHLIRHNYSRPHSSRRTWILRNCTLLIILLVPIDHFHNESKYEPHSDATFHLRYWFDASHYEPGGPVIIIAAGETDGSGK